MSETFLTACVRINQLDLNSEFVRVPSDLAYWSDRYADTIEAYGSAKTQRERMYSELYAAYQFDLQTRLGPKGAPSATVDACVLRDPRYIATKETETKEEANKSRMYGIVDAIRTKRDMLVQLGAQSRSEMNMQGLVAKQQSQVAEINKWGNR